MDNIRFEEETHTYYLNDNPLISTTQLMQKHNLAPDYSNVPTSVLNKKADKGTKIHAEIERWIKTGEFDFDCEMETLRFIAYAERNKLKFLSSELLVYDDLVGGTIDIVLENENGQIEIWDNKTTYDVHKEAVSWQISIYRKLYERLYNKEVVGGGCFHLSKNDFEAIPIQMKNREDVEELFEAERNGNLYEMMLKDNEAITNLEQLQKKLSALDEQKKAIENQIKEFKQRCLEEMNSRGLTKFEYVSNDGDKLALTLVAESSTEDIDKDMLKEDYPDIYNQYKVEKKKASYLKITYSKKKKKGD